MKAKYLILVVMMCVLIVSACSPAAETTSTTTPTQVDTSTPQPTATSTPTLEPSPTQIPYPDVLDQTFSGVHVTYRDDFIYKIQGQKPANWVIENENTEKNLLVSKDNQFRIITTNDPHNGIAFYYKGETIDPGEGVYFSFKYKGNMETFTWGMDNLDKQGNIGTYKTEGYYSFAMQMLFTTFTAHVIEGVNLKHGDFIGDLKLQEDTWYDAVVAFDKNENFIIKVWQPDATETQLVYIRNCPGYPDKFYFVGWLSSERQEVMDNFTIFTFDSILVQ